MTDPNVKNIASGPKPDGSGKRKFRDVAWIVIACGILATVVHSSVAFVVLSCVMIGLYVAGGPPRR